MPTVASKSTNPFLVPKRRVRVRVPDLGPANPERRRRIWFEETDSWTEAPAIRLWIDGDFEQVI